MRVQACAYPRVHARRSCIDFPLQPRELWPRDPWRRDDCSPRKAQLVPAVIVIFHVKILIATPRETTDFQAAMLQLATAGSAVSE